MAAPQPNVDLTKILDRIETTNALSRQDYLQLTHALLSSQPMTDDDCRRVNRCLDRLQNGRITLSQT
ncbi:MAG: hypothetical protein AAGF75_01990 [Cyanobacteria bacterium P01_H01_bin.130]